MTIDLKERLYTLREAVRFFPLQRNGKRINLATVYRYTTKGLMGVVLTATQAGNVRCVTERDIADFFSALTALRKQRHSAPDMHAAEAVGQRLRRTAFARKMQALS